MKAAISMLVTLVQVLFSTEKTYAQMDMGEA